MCLISSNTDSRFSFNPNSPCAFSKVLRPEKLADHVFEVDEDVEKDEVNQLFTNLKTSKSNAPCPGIVTTWSGPVISLLQALI